MKYLLNIPLAFLIFSGCASKPGETPDLDNPGVPATSSASARAANTSASHNGGRDEPEYLEKPPVGGGTIIILDVDDPVPQFDDHFSFAGYFPAMDGRTVHYFWNDAEVGVGMEGYISILKRLSHLSPGTRILEYPRVDARLIKGQGSLMETPPYGDDANVLYNLIRDNGLILIKSYKDIKGNIIDQPIIRRMKTAGMLRRRDN